MTMRDAAPATPATLHGQTVRLWWAKLGRLMCRHADRVIVTGDRMFVKCDVCDRERPGIVLTNSAKARWS